MKPYPVEIEQIRLVVIGLCSRCTSGYLCLRLDRCWLIGPTYSFDLCTHPHTTPRRGEKSKASVKQAVHTSTIAAPEATLT